jgi:hypothetical protein
LKGRIIAILVFLAVWGILTLFNDGAPVGEEYFLITTDYSGNTNLIAEMYVVGWTESRQGWEYLADRVIRDIKADCPDCKIARKQQLNRIPQVYRDMFNNEKMDFYYVSADSRKYGGLGIRMYFPDLGQDFNKRECKNLANFMSRVNSVRYRCI